MNHPSIHKESCARCADKIKYQDEHLTIPLFLYMWVCDTCMKELEALGALDWNADDEGVQV